MAQVLDSSATERVSYTGMEENQFDYRPVPVHAVVAVTLGVLGATSLLSLTGVAVALLGVLVGGFSLWRIRAAGGALGGSTVATIGLALSVLFFGGGTAYQTYLYRTEVPDGYQRISFTNDISRKGFVTVEGAMDLHDDVKPLIGEELFLKGFIFPPDDKTTPLRSFVLVKDNGLCCFGSQPATEDMIAVVLDGEQTVRYSTGMMSVAGTLQLNPRYTPGEPLYLMAAQIVTKSRSTL